MKKAKKNKAAKASKRKPKRKQYEPIVRIDVTPLNPRRYDLVNLQGEVWDEGPDDESFFTDAELILARPVQDGEHAYLCLRGDVPDTRVFPGEVRGNGPRAAVQFSENEIDAMIAMLQQAKRYFAGGKLKATRKEEE